MLEVCPSIAAAGPTCEIHPLGIGAREDPVRLVFTAAPAPGVVLGIADMGDRFRLVANEITVVEPDAPLPQLPVARAIWKPKPNLSTSAESWLQAGGPHHTVLSTAVGTAELTDFAAMAGVELLVIDDDTTDTRVRQRAALESGLLPAGQGVLTSMASLLSRSRSGVGGRGNSLVKALDRCFRECLHCQRCSGRVGTDGMHQ